MVLAAALAVVVLGATPLALVLLAVCGLGMAPAAVIFDRVERRGPGD